MAKRQAPALAAAEPFERLVDLFAAEEEATEQCARLVGRQPGALGGGLEHGTRAPALELLGVLTEVADLDVVARAQPAAVELSLADQRLDEGRLAGAVGPDERDVLAALEPQLGVGEQDARRIGADLQARVVELEDDAPRALGLLEGELEPAPVARVALDALDLVELLEPVLGLARLGRLVAEALDEALHALDLGLLLLDRAAEGELARRLLAAPRVPGAVEEARAARLELEHRGADRLQEPAVVGHEHDGRVEVEQRLLEPLERLDVEMVGRLVEQQQVGLGGERARQRGARELAAGERSQRAVEIVVDEPEAMDDRARPLAPAIAADGLEARLHARVAVHGLLVARGHRVLQALQLRLELDRLARARENVFPEAELAFAGRALVVQRDARALGEHELAAVDRGLPGQHPQQGRLAGAVAPGDGHALAALELERDAAQQWLSGHVLAEIRSDEDRHNPHGRLRRHAIRTDRAGPRGHARRAGRSGRDGDRDPGRRRSRPLEVRQGLRHQVRAQERQAGARAHARLLRRRGRLHARRARDRRARAGPSGVGARPPLTGARGHVALRRRPCRAHQPPAGLRLLPRMAFGPVDPAALPAARPGAARLRQAMGPVARAAGRAPRGAQRAAPGQARDPRRSLAGRVDDGGLRELGLRRAPRL